MGIRISLGKNTDYTGPFEDKYFSVVMDSYTKWLEVQMVPNTDCMSTIRELRNFFFLHLDYP